MHVGRDRLEDYANGRLDVGERRGVARHISSCAQCASRLAKEMVATTAVSTAVFGRHLGASEVEALALGKDFPGNAEAEEHVSVCIRCRSEVEDIARVADTISAGPEVLQTSSNEAPSRLSLLLQMSDKAQRNAAVSTTWSPSELQEMNAEVITREKDGPASGYAAAELLSLMCDHADDGVPPAILNSLKLLASYRMVFSGTRCGKIAEAFAALNLADELARDLPNADHFLARLDIAHLYVHTDFASPHVCAAESADLHIAADIALSFGDEYLFYLTEHYKGVYYHENGRYDLASKAFVAAAQSSNPWHRQSALYSASAAFYRLGDIDRAEEYLILSENQPVDPPYPQIVPRFIWQHGLIALGRGRYTQARGLICEAIDLLAPMAGHDVIFLYIDLAEANLLAGDYMAAIEAAQHAAAYFSSLPPSVALNQAIGLLQEAFSSRDVARIRASLDIARRYARGCYPPPRKASIGS